MTRILSVALEFLFVFAEPSNRVSQRRQFRRVCLTCDSIEMFTGCALIDLVENVSDATRAMHSARFTPAEWLSCRQQQGPIFMMISFVCCTLLHLSTLHTSRSTRLRFPRCRRHLALHEFISESHSVRIAIMSTAAKEVLIVLCRIDEN